MEFFCVSHLVFYNMTLTYSQKSNWSKEIFFYYVKFPLINAAPVK